MKKPARHFFVLMALFSLSGTAGALAQQDASNMNGYDPYSQGNNGSLSGRVDMNVNRTRLNRPGYPGAPMQNDGEFRPGYNGPPGGYNPGRLDGRAQDMQQAFPDYNFKKQKGNKGQKMKNKGWRPIGQPQTNKPHIWQVSKLGGYYDASGQIEGTVPGDQLYKYGGFMGDGVTPVPQTPVGTDRGGLIRWQQSWKRFR